MKVNTESNNFHTTQRAQTSTATGTDPASFSSSLTAATAETSTVKQADFTRMTRKEVFDWMNDQIRSGKMSLDESSPPRDDYENLGGDRSTGRYGSRRYAHQFP